MTQEKHYRVSELAALWSMSPDTIRRLFRDEPGVMKLSGMNGKRSYNTLFISDSAARRVSERLENALLQEPRSSTRPLGVVRLSSPNTTMPKQSRNIFKRDARKQLSSSKRVA